MIIATAGHVDHGKTALVKALTGVDTDRLEEERRRGLSINLGFAYASTDAGKRLGFVDVPGHIRFIANMVAGVAGIDLALLAVAADDGVMPQTIEHLDILQLLGVGKALVALTKIDRASPARQEEVAQAIQALLAGSRFRGAAILPVSAITGEGMEALQQALAAAAKTLESRRPRGHFRLAIDRRFTVKGAGLVVTGSVFAGQVNLGDELLLAPQMQPVKVRGLRVQDQAAETAAQGDRAAVNIAGQAQLRPADIHRGDWLTANPAPASSRFDARLRLLASAGPLRHWTPVHLHTAASHTTARVAVLEGGAIQPGEEGLVQIQAAKPVSLCLGDLLLLRDQAALQTLGGATVLAVDSPARGRARPARLAWLKALDPDDLPASLARLLQLQSGGVALEPLAQAWNLSTEALAGLLPAGAISIQGELALAAEHLEPHLDAAQAALRQWHAENPGKPGLPLGQLARHFPSATLAEFVMEKLLERKAVARKGSLWALPGHAASLSKREAALFAKAEPLLAARPSRPPVVHELAAAMKVPPQELGRALEAATKLGLLLRPARNRYYLPEGMASLRASLEALAAAKGSFTVQDFRDATGIGRNLSIEILEHFDSAGLTRRSGDARRLVP